MPRARPGGGAAGVPHVWRVPRVSVATPGVPRAVRLPVDAGMPRAVRLRNVPGGADVCPGCPAPPPACPSPPPAPAVAAAPATFTTPPTLARMVWTRPAGAPPPPASCRGSPPFTSLLWLAVESRFRNMASDLCGTVWKSLAAAGARVVVLGESGALHEKHVDCPTYYHTKKLQLVHAFLAANARLLPDPDHTLVVHGDMSDSVLFSDLTELLDCMSATWCERRLDAASDVLFVGERGLWPPRENLYPRAQYNFSDEDASGDYKFLNSGVYGGSPGALRGLLAGAMAAEIAIPTHDDQEVLNYMGMQQPEYRRRIHLDQSHRCFGSAYEHRGEIHMVGQRLRQNKTGGTPALVHFNSGFAKHHAMPAALNSTVAFHARWNESALAGGQVVLLGHTWDTSQVTTFAEICRPLERPPR